MDACPGLFDDISSELEDINLNVENVDSSHNEKVLLRSIISDDAKEASIVHELLMDKARGLQANVSSQIDKNQLHVPPSYDFNAIIKLVLDIGERSKKIWKCLSQQALRKNVTNDWSKLFTDIKPQSAKRLRYDGRNWAEDIIQIKMEMEPFSHGAMRECFRAKKMGNFSMKNNWAYASNVVLKRYLDEVDTTVLFDDVVLQMEAKLWAGLYNKQNPPKKIDIMQICIIQMVDAPNQPYFQMEHFIDGNYVKYNSNSGFISEDHRRTPQAFSHFTFEKSNHEKMVVDIQGVSDLWTDPQIHSANSLDYGDGNLGVRGMALFLLSHRCNKICEYLDLPKFKRHPTEMTGRLRESIDTTIEGLTKIETMMRLKNRGGSVSSNDSVVLSAIRERHKSYCSATSVDASSYGSILSDFGIDDIIDQCYSKAADGDVLREIHYTTCQLYCQERIPFSNDASIFHLAEAAQMGHLESMSVYSKKLLGVQSDILEEIKIEVDLDEGWQLLEKAGECGDSYSKYLSARAYHTGIGLPSSVTVDWSKADKKYSELIHQGVEIGTPNYVLLQYKAEMKMRGGNNLPCNPEAAAELFEEAAEEATNLMKGKQAAKYFEMAEVAWSMI